MNMIKWDPFRELEDVSNRLNRLFTRSAVSFQPDRELLKASDWMPSVDISETDAGYQIKAEIPEVKKEDVKVSIENGMLTIQGELKQEKEEKGKKFHRIERSFGSFARSFQMPGDVDESAVQAEFKDGMLNIMLAKSKKTRSNTVKVPVT